MGSEGKPLMTFLHYLALGYLAAALLAGGIYHAARLTSFSDTVQSHRIIPASIAMPAAILVTIFELAAGGAALFILFSQDVAARAALLFSSCTVIGVVFALYVRRLLRNPQGSTSCGCSAFAGPLTIASIVPALALALVSGLGLATAGPGFKTILNPNFSVALPLLWGITLALIVNLIPASMPRPAF
ncbi:MAG TPA: MauE/DoxX family redox-associated membrane protein [Pyrinomonadaceae bacterium]|nr:MauE/DoxX family redox-associated membrane protein [Pyrinomonadaceae bacterium]